MYRTSAYSFDAHRAYAEEIAETANEALLIEMIMTWPVVYQEAARARICLIVRLASLEDAERKARYQ